MTDAERALQNLRHGSDGVLEALWRELPSPYDLDTEDREGAVNLLQALVDAALADADKRMERAAERARKLILEGEGKHYTSIRVYAGTQPVSQQEAEAFRPAVDEAFAAMEKGCDD